MSVVNELIIELLNKEIERMTEDQHRIYNRWMEYERGSKWEKIYGEMLERSSVRIMQAMAKIKTIEESMGVQA